MYEVHKRRPTRQVEKIKQFFSRSDNETCLKWIGSEVVK